MRTAIAAAVAWFALDAGQSYAQPAPPAIIKTQEVLRAQVAKDLASDCGFPSKIAKILAQDMIKSPVPDTSNDKTMAVAPLELFGVASEREGDLATINSMPYDITLPTAPIWLPTPDPTRQRLEAFFTCNGAFELALDLLVDARIAEIQSTIKARKTNKTRARWAWGRIRSPLWARLDAQDPRAQNAARLRLWSFWSTNWSDTKPPSLKTVEYIDGFYTARWTQTNWSGNFSAKLHQSADWLFFEDELDASLKKDAQGGMSGMAAQIGQHTVKWKALPTPARVAAALESASTSEDPKVPSGEFAVDGAPYDHVRLLKWVEEEFCKDDLWSVEPPKDWSGTAKVSWLKDRAVCQATTSLQVPSRLFATKTGSAGLRKQQTVEYQLVYGRTVNKKPIKVPVKFDLTLTADLAVSIEKIERIAGARQWRVRAAVLDPYGRLTNGAPGIAPQSNCPGWTATVARPSLESSALTFEVAMASQQGYQIVADAPEEECVVSVPVQLPVAKGTVPRSFDITLSLPRIARPVVTDEHETGTPGPTPP